MNTPPILIEDLRHTYPGGNEALQGVNLKVQAGERLAVLGHNGAGKTTLVRHLNGLLAPTGGKVWINGLDTQHTPVENLSHSIGYVFQNPDDQLFARTIREEVAFGPHNLGFSADRVNEQVREALDACGLEGLAERHPFDISYSKRRWVAIASVVAMDTPILVLDEPTAGQDAAGLKRLQNLLDRLHRKGKTILTVSHDLAFCAENFERALVLKNGKAIFDGSFQVAVREIFLLEEASLQLPQVTQLGFLLGLSKPVLRTVDFLPEYRFTFAGRLKPSNLEDQYENPGVSPSPQTGSAH